MAPSFMAPEVLGPDDVDVAGQGDEEVADRRGLGHRPDLEPVHPGLQRRQRVDLGDDHVAPAPRARLATPRPHQPYPATTTVLPASSRLVARMMPSSVDWPVP